MAAAKHTAGPWRRHMSTVLATKEGNSAVHVARIVAGWGVRDPDELLANAALIVEAPALLAALRDMVAYRRREHLDCTVEPYAACAALVDKLGDI